ncbi:MAG: AAA family ATPase [Candidatus Omnitrophota bacterium]
MVNPFRFGQTVEGDDFCNRGRELEEVKKSISNHYSIWIVSPRGFGKTSLIFKAFHELKGIKTIYINLYSVQSLSDFTEKYFQVIFKNFFELKKGIKSITEKSGIENILEIPEKIASEKDINICIAFDEFQEVNRIDPFLINRMRSAFQNHRHISYVFLGSKQSLMETIFADSNSPFYEFGRKISIDKIERSDWEQFLKEKFKRTGLNIAESTIEAIIDKSGGHPHFTQYFASMAWELLLEGIDDKEPQFTETWMNRIVAGQSILFQNMFDQFNQNQRKVLTAIASLKPGEQLFSEESRKQFQLPTTSTVSVTIHSLLKKELIYKQNGNYFIANPVLKEWLIQYSKGKMI